MSRKKRKHRERKRKARETRNEKQVKGHDIDMGPLFITGLVHDSEKEG